jgi:hypothetical protein
VKLFTDASDRLSPIVVKELRQGVRGNVFTGAFLLMILVVVVVLSLSLLASPGPGREGFTFGFWFFVAIPLLLILPLGAAVAIAGEVSGNTLEPLLLTRLTAWRVVAGKWSATASQAVVLAVALLPFVFVRYYLGMVEVTNDAALLAAFVAWSLLLAAVTVAIAAARLSVLLRSLLVVVVGLALLITFVSFLEQVAPARRTASPGGVASVVLLVVLVLLSALESGALQIAPPALFQPARLRLLALVALGLAVWTGTSPWAMQFRGQVVTWTVVLAVGVCLAALCEHAPLLPSRYAPFYGSRWRAPLRFFLAPGWPAGGGFVIVVALAAAAAAATSYGWASVGLALGGILGTLLLPVAVGRTFFPRRGRPFLILVVVTFVSFALSAVAIIGLESGAGSLWSAGRFLLPFCPAIYALGRMGLGDGVGVATMANATSGAFDIGFVLFVGLVLAVTLVQVVRAWRGINRLMAGRAAA